jgi:hypothetical protein
VNLYLLDTNIFIEAYKSYYAFDICPPFWEFLKNNMIQGSNIRSIKQVYDEIKSGDALSIWIKKEIDKNVFLQCDDSDTQQKFQQIADYVSKNYPINKIGAFLSVADPLLIAKAQSLGAAVVTREGLKKHSKIKIPDVCKHFDIRCINTFDMLRELKIILK